jgi:hypothetical protein
MVQVDGIAAPGAPDVPHAVVVPVLDAGRLMSSERFHTFK